MFILILGYNECGEWVYEVEHHDNSTEVYKSLMAHKHNVEYGDRLPDSVEVAKTIDDLADLHDDELADLIEDWDNIGEVR